MLNALLFAVASGRGKGRGTIGGTAATGTFSTVMFSNGEGPISGYSQEGGGRARTIELLGMPFGGVDAKTAEMVTGLNTTLRDHYGRAGPLFVSWLLQQRDLWDTFAEDAAHWAAVFAAAIPTDSKVDRAITSRLAGYFGIIQMTAMWVHEALSLPWRFTAEPLHEVWNEIVSGATDALPEERALALVVSWAYANQSTFVGREETVPCGQEEYRKLIPSRGWSGHWSNKPSWEFLGFYSHVLDEILTRHGFSSPMGIRAAWQERGWLKHNKDRNDLRVAGESTHLVAIRRWSIDLLSSAEGEVQ